MGRYNMKCAYRVTARDIEELWDLAGVKTVTITVIPSTDGWNEKVGVYFDEDISKIASTLEACEHIAFYGDLFALLRAKNRKMGKLRTSTFGRCVYGRLLLGELTKNKRR